MTDWQIEPKNPYEKMLEALRRGLIEHDVSKRQNPHHRSHTKKYSDGRQKRGRAHYLSNCVGNNFVKPQPSAKARIRKAKKNETLDVGESQAG